MMMEIFHYSYKSRDQPKEKLGSSVDQKPEEIKKQLEKAQQKRERKALKLKQ